MSLTYFPEGDTAAVGDDELRSLHKLCSQLYDELGPGTLTMFPEGCEPLPGDTEERLLKKINALLQ